MAKQNWSEIGNIISDAVQEAIDTEDFSKLSQSIQGIVGDAVSSAADSMARGVSSAADSVIRGITGTAAGGVKKTEKGAKVQAQNPWKGNGQFEKKTVSYMAAKDIPNNEIYTTGGATRAAGYVLTAVGGFFTFLLGIGELTAVMFHEIITILLQLPFLAVSVYGLYKGLSMLGKIKRFKGYVRALGTRKCISIRELASSVNRSESATLSDVRKMIQDGMFRQGHLDLNGKNLFVTNQGYEAYLQDQQRMEEKKVAAIQKDAQEQKERNAYKTNSALSDEVKRLIEEGRQYTDKIRAGNEAIKDEAVSQKLDGLEAVVAKIFQYVEQNPQSADETKKLMKYYLPTTIKLLDSYQKLDSQPVQGPNILKSKKEIEQALDTLNQAFARLFDNLYQDASMDITSDISVLNTLLAQEGLTGEKM